MAAEKLTLETVNSLSLDEFTSRLGFLFEGSPWVAAAAWGARPFAGFDDLHAALCDVVRRAPLEHKLRLIRAHPDLAGRAAQQGAFTPESQREQASAGLSKLRDEDVDHLARLNAQYKSRFGFPFVICARENRKASIVAGFHARLSNSRDEEIDAAITEIEKIARLRLVDILARD